MSPHVHLYRTSPRRSVRFALVSLALAIGMTTLSAQAQTGWVSTTTPQAMSAPPSPICEIAGSSDQSWVIYPLFYGNVFVNGTAPYCIDGSELTPLDPSTPLHLLISLQFRHKAQLQSFLHDVTQPGTSVYGHYLSHAQFLASYAPTIGQALAVVNYLKQGGFTNIEVAPNNLLIRADGTVGQISTAFNTPMKQWSDRYYATGYGAAGPVQVPASLGDIVDSVQGLRGLLEAGDSYAPMPPPQVPVAQTGYSPTDYATIYDADHIGSGNRTSVALITQGDMAPTIRDLHSFTQSHHLPWVPTRVIPTERGSLGTGSAQNESQAIVGAAGGLANLSFYTIPSKGIYAPLDDLTWAYNRVVSDDTAKIIESSWGVEEVAGYLSGAQAQDDAVFMAAQAQGQIFVVATGANSQVGNLFSGVWQIPQEPATSPYVVAIGGSQVSTDSALHWTGESVWSELSIDPNVDPGLSMDNEDYWDANAGYSLYESVPAWQASVASTVQSAVTGSTPPTTQRYIPDLAFDAHVSIPPNWPAGPDGRPTPGGPTSGARIIVDGVEQRLFNGTELSASIFTGLFARIESAHDNSLGLPTPLMYQSFAKDPSPLYSFTSTTPKSNDFYDYQCNPPSPTWSPCSGWGSLDFGLFNSYVSKYWMR